MIGIVPLHLKRLTRNRAHILPANRLYSFIQGIQLLTLFGWGAPQLHATMHVTRHLICLSGGGRCNRSCDFPLDDGHSGLLSLTQDVFENSVHILQRTAARLGDEKEGPNE